MELETLLALAGYALAGTWTPGPNNMMLTASGATFGHRATLPHAMGVACGVPIMVFLVAVGMGEVFQRSETLRTGLAWAGFAVMIYLAWRIATAGPAKARGPSRPLTFLEACGFQWINPKAWVMVIGSSSTYSTGEAPVRDATIIAAVFLCSGLTSSQAWTAFGAAIGRFLGTGVRLRVFNIAMGLLLAVSALYMVAVE